MVQKQSVFVDFDINYCYITIYAKGLSMTEETTTSGPKPRFGIIQSRGLGDLVIALPIAYHYYQQGYQVVWPICAEFFDSMFNAAPWVDWVPMEADRNFDFFYKKPEQIIKERHCADWVCLYQSLTGHPELAGRPYFQIQKFDEHKYTAAGVPFRKKWTLSQCIARNTEREQLLYNRVVREGQPYYVTHLKGSAYTAKPDLSSLPKEWVRIDVDDNATESIFDWIKVIEGAEALVCVDSVIANMVDMLDLTVDKYWVPRSHIHLTPVLGSIWTILDVPEDSIAASKIFQSAQ